MKKYSVDGTSVTPLINFDLTSGELEIKGFSIPEDSITFYKPLNEALDKYTGSAPPLTNVIIELEYFNTSSSKCLLGILKKLEAINKNGSAVTINWHYEEGDEDMLQAGEDYHSIINVPFKMAQVTDIRSN